MAGAVCFFIAQGFIKTGCGERIAYHIILLVGQSTLGLSYALVIVDFILAPFIPSVCARGRRDNFSYCSVTLHGLF
ncbi:MAG: anion permease [Candidatus Tisiphia sp.]